MSKPKPLAVSYERCHELLELCAPSPLRLEKESGLKWKVSRQGTKGKGSWAGHVWEGKQCGKTRKDWKVMIDGRLYLASRIIYFMAHGVDPYLMQVDHEDINSLNNSVDNLRLGGDVLQKQNRRMQSNNTSGVKGVGWDKGVSKWRAYIEVENKRKHLGLFTTLKEAAEARNAVIKKYWPEEVWASNLIDLDLIKD